jgi:hypothetical protein
MVRRPLSTSSTERACRDRDDREMKNRGRPTSSTQSAMLDGITPGVAQPGSNANSTTDKRARLANADRPGGDERTTT